MKPFHFLRLGPLVSAAISLLVLNELPAQQLRLNPPVVLSNHVIELSLTGTVAGTYSFEMSTNLSNWLLLSNGIATNNLLTIQHPGASNFPRLFYRAHSTNVSLPALTVGVKQDTNVTVTTLMSLNGGHGELYGRDGTRFILTLASNSTPDPQLITVRLVTNLTSLPFARGTLGAIIIEPTNLVLWGAATLEIDLATNIDKREIISFRANRDGSGFQLTPDRVRTNRVVIPITQAGVYGSALATASEVANAALIDIGGGSSLKQIASAPGSKFKPASVGAPECFPAKQQVADAVQSQLAQALAEKSRHIEALIGAERQRQQPGFTEDSPSALSAVADDFCAFYTAEILPRWVEAAATCNCPLAPVLLEFSNKVERQRPLMGVTNGCVNLGTLPICVLLHCCVADIRACCEMGFKGSTKVAAIRAILREQELLLYPNCVTFDEAEDAVNVCSSNAWTGSFSVVESGRTNSTDSANGHIITDVVEYDGTFDGMAVESAESGSPPSLQVQINFAGAQSGRDFTSKTTILSSTCPAGSQRGASSSTQFDSQERVTAGDTTYQVNLITQPGGTFFIFGNQLHSATNMSAPATYTVVAYKQTLSCNGSDSTVNNSTASASFFTAMSLPVTFGTMTGSNIVSGTSTVTDTGIVPPRTYVFKWNFQRNASLP
jgi:hypothetical protein